MRIFGLFEGERVPLELPEGVPVKEVKETIWRILNIPEESGNQEKKVMVLTYGGSDLDNDWIFSDLGIRPGVTVKVSLQEEVKPVLFVYCAYNGRTINMYNNPQVGHMRVAALKTFVTRQTGIPVGVYRLVTRDGREMFDSFYLEDYGVDVSHTIHMETWDGWNDFLRLSGMGYTGNVMSNLFQEEAVSRYQMKVALFIAAHFGHVDLAVNLLRNGIRPNEPIGDHPTRQWCAEQSHVDSLKTPVHEATELGHLRIVRAFVNHDIRCVLVRDGRGLTPMSVALRNKRINIVQFLVTKLWLKFPVFKNQHIALQVYCRTKDWCEKAKERVFVVRGPSKSSIKKRPLKGALVSNGVIVDGFSASQMKARPKAIPKNDGRRRLWENWKTGADDPEIYFRRIHMFDRTIGALKTKRANKWGKMMDKAMVGVYPYLFNANSAESPITPSSGTSIDGDPDGTSRLKLPPISGKKGDGLSFNFGSSVLSARGSIAESATSEQTTRSVFKKLPHPTSRKKVTAEPDFSTSVPNLRISDSSPTASKRHLGSRSTFTSNGGQEDRKSRDEDSTDGRRRRRRKARTISSAVLLSNSKKSGNGALPLPVLTLDDTAHPKFYHTPTESDIAESTLNLYEKYRGMKSRDYAIKCMTIANSFKEKPWLERVQIALNLTSNTVKKRYWEPKRKRGRNSHRKSQSVPLSTRS